MMKRQGSLKEWICFVSIDMGSSSEWQTEWSLHLSTFSQKKSIIVFIPLSLKDTDAFQRPHQILPALRGWSGLNYLHVGYIVLWNIPQPNNNNNNKIYNNNY